MTNRVQTEYEAPVILDTFSALEVMGAAEGLVGNGSTPVLIEN